MVVVIYAAAVWQAPHLLNQQVLGDNNLDPADRLAAEHNARVMVISLGGALVISIGLLFTARTYRLARRGQVIERFAKALERLASPEPYVRIGAIYALEHVMQESADHHADVVEVLIAFIRDRAPHVGAHHDEEFSIYPRLQLPPELATEVQAVLYALANRPARPQLERGHLHLHDLHLRGAWLSKGNLRDADLAGAHLQDAHLDGAHLERADLTGADLTGADLTGADLRGATLRRAKLQHAKLDAALLDGADLSEGSGQPPIREQQI